jgi:hypothetical protein
VEVRRPAVPLVDIPLPRTAGKSSPESQPRRRPPQRDAHRRRRLSVLVDPLVEFAASSSSSGDKSCAKPRLGARDRSAPARSPSCAAAFAGVPAAVQFHSDGLDLIQLRVKPVSTGQPTFALSLLQ